MADDLRTVRSTIYEAISAIRLIDPHTHINPHDAGSHTLADILGYHYYTELVHSAGMPRGEIEEPGISPRELVGRMVHGLGNITNTANYHWLIHICQEFFGFQDDAITPDNWESLFDEAEATMNSAQWPQMVLDKSNVESVFLTNDFDDELEGFDSSVYIPCLRTDDLVFHLAKVQTRDRLEACSGVSLDGSLSTLRSALEQRFEHFVTRGARACAISIPPSFTPTMVSDGRALNALDHLLQQGTSADPAHIDAMSRRIFWTLAELCDEYGLPFDLMIGVNRQVYPAGVYQGQDLYDSRVSLIQYRELFNAFPKLKFPISVLASVTNQELVSYSWIFPNVYTNGHWWYSNTPSFIYRDAAARLEAVPRNKQVAYYSDAYKLEFVLPKFDMYRRVLARILAEQFVGENGWSEEKAIELGRQVLRGNVDELFPSPLIDDTSQPDHPQDDLLAEEHPPLSFSGGNESTVDPAAGPDANEFLGAVGVTAGAGALGAFALADQSDDPAKPMPGDPEATLDEIEALPEESPTAIESDTLAVDQGSMPQEVPQEVPQQETVQQPTDIAEVESSVEESDAASDDDLLLVEDSESLPAVVAEGAEGDDPASELSAFLEMDEEDAVFQTIDDDADKTVPVDPDATVADLSETVEDVSAADFTLADEIEPLPSEEIDPLPTADEIRSTDVADVQLAETPVVEDVVSLETEIDPIPLDIGNILGENGANPTSPDQHETPIEFLTGDGQVNPDGGSMILQTDPTTGELIYPVNDDASADADDDLISGD
ncbi:MAG: glucuronate isomerase [Planctomycetota bacterium]